MRLYVYKDTKAGGRVMLVPGRSTRLPAITIQGRKTPAYWDEVAAAIDVASDAAKPILVQGQHP